jgi:hypothetical protein
MISNQLITHVKEGKKKRKKIRQGSNKPYLFTMSFLGVKTEIIGWAGNVARRFESRNS